MFASGTVGHRTFISKVLPTIKIKNVEQIIFTKMRGLIELSGSLYSLRDCMRLASSLDAFSGENEWRIIHLMLQARVDNDHNNPLNENLLEVGYTTIMDCGVGNLKFEYAIDLMHDILEHYRLTPY